MICSDHHFPLTGVLGLNLGPCLTTDGRICWNNPSLDLPMAVCRPFTKQELARGPARFLRCGMPRISTRARLLPPRRPGQCTPTLRHKVHATLCVRWQPTEEALSRYNHSRHPLSRLHLWDHLLLHLHHGHMLLERLL